MVKRIKKRIREIRSEGLSLIEVLIVMAVTGLTLVALLNLAAHDLEIETINEAQDEANYISLSQLQEFDAVKSGNTACIQKLAANYQLPTPIQYYLICQNSNVTGYTQVAECDNQPNEKVFLYYENPQTASNTLYYDPNANTDCNPTAPAGSVKYQNRLHVIVGTSSTLSIDSQVFWVPINSNTPTTNQTEVAEIYRY